MKNIERHIQSRLYDYEASFSPDLWNKIEMELPKKEKNKRLFWIWFLPGFIVAGIILFLYGYNTMDIGDHQSISGLYQNSYESVPNLNPGTTKKITSQPLTEDKFLMPNKVQKDIVSNVSESSEIIKADNQNRSFREKVQNSIEDETLFEEKKSNSKLKVSEKLHEFSIQTRDNFIIPEIIVSRIPFIESMKKESISGPECPPFGKFASPGIFAEFYYSSDFPIKTFSSKNPEFTDYQAERKATESALYSFSTGVRVAYITAQKYGVKTGINYSQINEQFKYLDPNAYQSQTIITIDTIFSGGTFTVVTDTSYLSIPGSLEIQHKNQYKFLDVPLIGTYEFDTGNKFYYSIDIGVLFNFSFTQKGRFINESGDLAFFSTNASEGEVIYEKGAGMSLYGGVSLLYRWKKDIDFFVSPSVKHFNKSFTTSDYPLTQNYTIPSLNLGVRYKIN